MRKKVHAVGYCLFFLALPLAAICQKKKAYFKEGDSLRIKSTSNPLPEATITIVVPKNPGPGKTDVLTKGTLFIAADKAGSSVDLTNTRLPITQQFKLDSLKEDREITFKFTVPRDAKDDRVLTLQLTANDSVDKKINSIAEKIVIYIKPTGTDTLTSNKDFELWFLTGTNFDLFEGVKPQEFFLRMNTLFRITDRSMMQIALYKNRFFINDSSSGTRNYTVNKRPEMLGDSLVTLTSGTYRHLTKQTTDPLGLQIDYLYQLPQAEGSHSTFYATAGLDLSSSSVMIRNTYQDMDTSFYLRTSRPDTVSGFGMFGTTSFPETVTYKKASYQVNLGLMWIFNDDEINIKTHFTAGWSRFGNLKSYYQDPRKGIQYNFSTEKDIYLQLRMYATYKPIGLTFGMESVIGKNDLPAFNFTLSKAFDIRGFLRNLTPVSAIKTD